MCHGGPVGAGGVQWYVFDSGVGNVLQSRGIGGAGRGESPWL